MQIPAFCAEQGSGNKVPVKCDSIHPGTIIRSRKGRIMFCRKCGLKILPGAAFCSKCGEPVHTAEYCGGFWGITAEGKKDGTTVPSSFVQHAVPDSAGAGAGSIVTPKPRAISDAPKKRAFSDVQETRVLSDAPKARAISDAPRSRASSDAPDTQVLSDVPETRSFSDVPMTEKQAASGKKQKKSERDTEDLSRTSVREMEKRKEYELERERQFSSRVKGLQNENTMLRRGRFKNTLVIAGLLILTGFFLVFSILGRVNAEGTEKELKERAQSEKEIRKQYEALEKAYGDLEKNLKKEQERADRLEKQLEELQSEQGEEQKKESRKQISTDLADTTLPADTTGGENSETGDEISPVPTDTTSPGSSPRQKDSSGSEESEESEDSEDDDNSLDTENESDSSFVEENENGRKPGVMME